MKKISEIVKPFLSLRGRVFDVGPCIELLPASTVVFSDDFFFTFFFEISCVFWVSSKEMI